MPGSGIHGRKTRRCPAAYAFFARATARRVVRSERSKPSARSLSWTTSARTLPWLRSTHSSTLARCGSSAGSIGQTRLMADQGPASGRTSGPCSASSRRARSPPAGCPSGRTPQGSPRPLRQTSRRPSSVSGISATPVNREGRVFISRAGRSRGRQRAVFVAAGVQPDGRPRSDSHGRSHRAKARTVCPGRHICRLHQSYTIMYTVGLEQGG
jgi:hypothetical protein